VALLLATLPDLISSYNFSDSANIAQGYRRVFAMYLSWFQEVMVEATFNTLGR
jgi:hypothetical protein